MSKFIPSNYEYLIQYRSKNGHGEIVIDKNYYDKKSKIINRKLKDCEILLFAERKKNDRD